MLRRSHLFRVSLPFLTALLAAAPPGAAGEDRPAGRDPAIEPYIRFLEGHGQDPVDYILGLFKDHDLVVICERSHPEMTQYDLLLKVVGDRRFIEDVGHVFTEVGTRSAGPDIDSFLTDASLPEKEIDRKVLSIYEELSFFPLWDKTNFGEFLKGIHRINRALSGAERIHLIPTDQAFDWRGMTREKYREFEKGLGERDKAMADWIVEKMSAIREGPERRKKGLVIMNFRHAFPHFTLSRGGKTVKIQNTGGFLLEALPGKVANVMVNSVRILQGSRDSRIAHAAMLDGKWDAAFRALGDPARGFDFRGSPFGDDPFDYFPFPIPVNFKYRDEFTGFVFYKPLREHKMSFGIPGITTEAFKAELLRRFRDSGNDAPEEDLKSMIERIGSLQVFGYEKEDVFGKTDLEGSIGKWLGKPQVSAGTPAGSGRPAK